MLTKKELKINITKMKNDNDEGNEQNDGFKYLVLFNFVSS